MAAAELMQPPLPDLSGLTDEEREQIQSVLQRQKEEEDKNKQVISKLKEDYLSLALSVRQQQTASNSPSGQTVNIGDTCQVCLNSIPADSISHVCHYCHSNTCTKCGSRATFRVKNKPNAPPGVPAATKWVWTCVLCQKKQEYLAKTGKWVDGGVDLPELNRVAPQQSQPGAPSNSVLSSQQQFGPVTNDPNMPRYDAIRRQQSLDYERSQQNVNQPLRQHTVAAISNIPMQNPNQQPQRLLPQPSNMPPPPALKHPQQTERQRSNDPYSSERYDRFDEPYVRWADDPRGVAMEGSGAYRSAEDEYYPSRDEPPSDLRYYSDGTPFGRSGSGRPYQGGNVHVNAVGISPSAEPPRDHYLDPRSAAQRRQRRIIMENMRADSLSSDPSDTQRPPPPRPRKGKRQTRQHSVSSSEDDLRSTPDCTSEDPESESISEKGELDPQMARGNLDDPRNISGPAATAGYHTPGGSRNTHPVEWHPSVDNKKLVGHMILKKGSSASNSQESGKVLGLKVTGGKATDSGQLGAFITKVRTGSIADTVGHLRPGDEVLEWNGRSLRDCTHMQVYEIICESRHESQVELIVQRNLGSELGPRPALDRHAQTKSVDTDFFSRRDRPDVTITSPGSHGTTRRRMHSPQPTGDIELQLLFDHSQYELVVTLNAAFDLPYNPAGQAPSVYCTLCLLPDSRLSRKRTRIVRDSFNPSWKQAFVFAPLREAEVRTKHLEIIVWDCDRVGDSHYIAEVLIDLNCEMPMEGQRRLYRLVQQDNHAYPIDDRASSDYRRLPEGFDYNRPDRHRSRHPDRYRRDRYYDDIQSRPLSPGAKHRGFSESRLYDDRSGVPRQPHHRLPSHYSDTDRISSHGRTSGASSFGSDSPSSTPSSSRKRQLPKVPVQLQKSNRDKVTRDLEEKTYQLRLRMHQQQSLAGGGYRTASDTETSRRRGQQHNRQYTYDMSDPGSELSSEPSVRSAPVPSEPPMGQVHTALVHNTPPTQPNSVPYGAPSRAMPSLPSSGIQPQSTIMNSNTVAPTIPRTNPSLPQPQTTSITSTTTPGVATVSSASTIATTAASATTTTTTSVKFAEGTTTVSSSAPKRATATDGSMSDSTGGNVAQGRMKRRPSLGKMGKLSSMMGLKRGEDKLDEFGNPIITDESYLSDPENSEGKGYTRSEEVGVAPGLSRIESVESTPNFDGTQTGELGDFVDGLGPGQVVGRQVLGAACLGEIQLSLHDKKGRLEIEVIRARNLLSKPGAKVLPATYVKIYLIEGKRCVEKQKTPIARNTLDPFYHQQVHFLEPYGGGRILHVTVWGDYGRMDRKVFMGAALIILRRLNLANTVIGWYRLYPSSSLSGHFQSGSTASLDKAGRVS